MQTRRWDVYGALAGLALGVVDTALLHWTGVEMAVAGRNAALAVGATFASSTCALGWFAGRLLRARVRERADAATIARQLAALEASQAAALESERLAALGRLAAGIAHEVRNPLGVIRASATLVQEGFARDTEAWRACEFIRDETERLNGLVTALLGFARPTELRARSVDVGALFERVALLAAEVLRARGAALERSLDPGLALVGDPDLLAQLLLDLVANAAEASERGGKVALLARAADGVALLEVADAGPGIPPAEAERVFEPFYSTKPSGTGLGLAMARRIALAHGGALEVVTGRGAGPEGAGACLRARLPLAGPGARARTAS